jgi:hypothetical protein
MENQKITPHKKDSLDMFEFYVEAVSRRSGGADDSQEESKS